MVHLTQPGSKMVDDRGLWCLDGGCAPAPQLPQAFQHAGARNEQDPDHFAPAERIARPQGRGRGTDAGMPESAWKMTSMPSMAIVMASQRKGVIASPRKMRARSVLHSGVR